MYVRKYLCCVDTVLYHVGRHFSSVGGPERALCATQRLV